jgi:hypothetical protein
MHSKYLIWSPGSIAVGIIFANEISMCVLLHAELRLIITDY